MQLAQRSRVSGGGNRCIPALGDLSIASRRAAVRGQDIGVAADRRARPHTVGRAPLRQPSGWFTL